MFYTAVSRLLYLLRGASIRMHSGSRCMILFLTVIAQRRSDFMTRFAGESWRQEEEEKQQRHGSPYRLQKSAAHTEALAADRHRIQWSKSNNGVFPQHLCYGSSFLLSLRRGVLRVELESVVVVVVVVLLYLVVGGQRESNSRVAMLRILGLTNQRTGASCLIRRSFRMSMFSSGWL